MVEKLVMLKACSWNVQSGVQGTWMIQSQRAH